MKKVFKRMSVQISRGQQKRDVYMYKIDINEGFYQLEMQTFPFCWWIWQKWCFKYFFRFKKGLHLSWDVLCVCVCAWTMHLTWCTYILYRVVTMVIVVEVVVELFLGWRSELLLVDKVLLLIENALLLLMLMVIRTQWWANSWRRWTYTIVKIIMMIILMEIVVSYIFAVATTMGFWSCHKCCVSLIQIHH